jgi:hypothetical protein
VNTSPRLADLLPEDNFRPSRIRLWDRSRDWPLAGLFGAPEADVAAALLVRSCTRGGDTFAEKHPRQIAKTMRADITDGIEPWITMWKDPRAPLPHFAMLVAKGYAEFMSPTEQWVKRWGVKDGFPVRFSVEGLMKLREVCEPCRAR